MFPEILIWDASNAPSSVLYLSKGSKVLVLQPLQEWFDAEIEDTEVALEDEPVTWSLKQ